MKSGQGIVLQQHWCIRLASEEEAFSSQCRKREREREKKKPVTVAAQAYNRLRNVVVCEIATLFFRYCPRSLFLYVLCCSSCWPLHAFSLLDSFLFLSHPRLLLFNYLLKERCLHCVVSCSVLSVVRCVFSARVNFDLSPLVSPFCLFVYLPLPVSVVFAVS